MISNNQKKKLHKKYRLENKFKMVFCIFRLAEYYTISANALATCHINTGGTALPIARY